MIAEKYLSRIEKIDAIISNKVKDYKRWVEIAEGLGDFSVSERVQSSKNLQKIPNAIGRYIDIDREIEALKRERLEIINTLEQLPNTEYELLYQVYVKGYTLKEVADYFDRSYDWVKKRKRKALLMVQAVLDEKTG